jgi:hypothetical protein
METKYFNLTDGSLEFNDEKLIIFDKAKRERISNIFHNISFLILSISYLTRGLIHDDNELLCFGIVLTPLYVVLIIADRNIFYKISNEYQLNDIKHVKFSINKLDNSIIATLLTKKNRKRRIKLVNENNQDFVLQNLLIEHHISVD